MNLNIITIWYVEQWYSEENKNVIFYTNKYEILKYILKLYMNAILLNFYILIKNKDFF